MTYKQLLKWGGPGGGSAPPAVGLPPPC